MAGRKGCRELWPPPSSGVSYPEHWAALVTVSGLYLTPWAPADEKDGTIQASLFS